MRTPNLESRQIADGKTKTILRHPTMPHTVLLHSKDRVTAGNGARSDTIFGKAEWANETACNIFELLNYHGVPTAYRGIYNEITMIADHCEMHPFEVVVRGAAYGSFLRRNPQLKPFARLKNPFVEFFLKTTGRKFGELQLHVDDPLIVQNDANSPVLYLWDPNTPLSQLEKPIATLTKYASSEFPKCWKQKDEMFAIAHKAFEILHKAFKGEGLKLIDCKVEFGQSKRTGELVIADVVDADSCRVLDENGDHLSKELYRQGAELDEVEQMYKKFARHTSDMI